MALPTQRLVLAAWFLSCFGLCGCDDERRIEEAAPRADSYFVGDSEAEPDAGAFESTPDSDSILIDFGLVDVDTVAKRYLFVRNTGRADLKLMEWTKKETSSDYFYLSCWRDDAFVSDCPVDADRAYLAAPGEDLVFEFSYAPFELGTDQGEITLISNAVGRSEITVMLKGQGVSAEIEVCAQDCAGSQEGDDCASAEQLCNDELAPEPLDVDFADADLSTQVSRQLLIHNLGDKELLIHKLELTSGAHTQFNVDTDDLGLPATLAAGAELAVWVEFSPTMGGEHESILTIRSSDIDEEVVQVLLRGRALAPRLCPDPLTLDFGNVASGTSRTLSFQVSNCGLLDLTVDNIALNPNPADPEFSLIDLPGLPLPITPAQTVDIQVEYHPAAHGRHSGGVDLFSDDPASDAGSGLTGTVALVGESTPQACDLQAVPFAVNFGGVVQNTTESTELIIANQGTAACLLEKVALSANSSQNEFSLLGSLPTDVTLLPGDTTLLSLEYLPVDLGPDEGVLTIYGNDKEGNEIPVMLGGEGVETAVCDVAFMPEKTLNFGLVKFGKTKVMEVEVINRGSAPCTVTDANLDISPVMGDYFKITSAPSYPATINKRGQAGSSLKYEVTFTPSENFIPDVAKTYFDRMNIMVDDPDLVCAGEDPPVFGKVCLNLLGMSKESRIEIVPSSLDFGLVTWGCNSPVQCVTVYNMGANAIPIDEFGLQDPPDANFEIVQAPMTPFALAGGDNFKVCLRYHPQDLANHRGVLIIKVDGDEEYSVPLLGTGTDLSDQDDVFYQPDRVRSDVLFVVDCSGSMSEDQENLAQNFDQFINWAVDRDVDFHIGVVSTDVDMADFYSGTPPRLIKAGVLVHTDQTPKIVTSTTPDFIDAFSINVHIGDTCSSTEAGLEGAQLALSEPLIDDPAANQGFFRRDAKLYIIIVSDEEDQSEGPVDFYVDYFQALKGYRNTEMLTISAICSDIPPDGRYYFASQATGGIFESIATADWAQTLTTMGIDAFAAIREFPLSRQADESTLVVTVDGVVVDQATLAEGADGWTYYPDTNTIFFGDDVVPDKGAKIEVHYSSVCL